MEPDNKTDPFMCAICGDYARDTVKLIGGYHTCLCALHMNEWHMFIQNAIEKHTYDSIDIRLQRAVYQAGTELEVLGLSKAERDAGFVLFGLGHEWVANERRRFSDTHAQKKA